MDSGLPLVQARDQPGDHLGDDFELSSQVRSRVLFDKPFPKSKFQKWDAFLRRAPSDCEEILSVGLCEPAVALGDVRGDRQGRPVQLIGQEVVPAGETFGQRCNLIDEVDCLLIHVQVLEHEGHRAVPLSR